MIAFPLGHVSTPAPARRGPGSGRLWTVLAVVMPVVAAAVSIAVAWNADNPSFPFDEIDQLQMSRLLAGLDVPKVTGGGYYPLWSFLIAPLWWILRDPFAVYAAALAIGIVVGLATILPLTLLARRLRLSTAQGVVVASIAVTMPSIALQSDYALSERLLFLILSVAVLTAWRLWERPTHLRAVVFAVTVAALYFTHVRVLTVVLASALWLVLFALRNWRVAITGLVVLIVTAAGADVVARELNVLLLGDFAQGENLLETLRATRPSLLLRSAIGQAWAQLVGSFGLAAVGLVALLRWTWQELRHLRAGRATYVLAITLALFLLTTIKWASEYHLFTRPWRRIDTWLYGRYIDPVTLILVVIALAVIIRGIRRSTVAWAGVVSLLLILPAVLWVGRDAPLWAYRTPAHIGGVMPWWWLLPDSPPVQPGEIPTLWNDGRFWVVASIATLLVLAVVFLLRRWGTIVVVLLAAAFTVATLVADQASNAFHDLEGAPPAAVQPLREALDGSGATVAFDMGCSGNGARDAIALNYYGYWLLPTVVSTFDASAGPGEADLIISCEEAPTPEVAGATLLPDSAFFDRAVWVRDGAIADELRGEGILP